MVYLASERKFVPAGEMLMVVNGLQNSLYYNIRMEHWQYMPVKKAFMDVLRDDHWRIVSAEDEEFKTGMESAHYYMSSVLGEMYPAISYLTGIDKQVKIGEYCCTFGTREVSNYVVKVGEAVCEPKDGGKEVWREGIYRVSNVVPPEMKG